MTTPDDQDDHPQARAWARSSVSAAPAALLASRSSPLAVSVSGQQTTTSKSKSHHHREFRGKCLYQSRKCENERALKRNGKAHNLCDEHRSKQNQHQRKFDAKKFSRKRRRDSGGEDQSGDEDDDAEDEDEAVGEVLKRETPVPPQAAPPKRKIRRFDGAKHAGRRPRHEMETASQQIKTETQSVTGGGGEGATLRSAAVLQLHAPEQYRGHPASVYQQSREYQPRSAPPQGYSALHSPVEQQQHYHYQYQHSHERGQAGYYPDALPGVHPSPRHAGYAGRPLVPLRSLSAIVSTTSSRIPVISQEDRGPTLEQAVYRQAGGRERRHTEGGLEARVGFAGRRASYDGGNAQPYPPQYQAERASYPPGRYPTSETSGARLPSPQAPGAAFVPQYSPSELIAASILVPSTAPTVRPPQYPETSLTERQYHQHTSVSPRGMPPMYHPSSYAISPHHARLQASASASSSYLRAQQMQISGEREAHSEPPQRRHSPPAVGAPPPSRMLPSLATRVPAAISSAPTGSGAKHQQYCSPQDGHQPPLQSQHQSLVITPPVLPSLAPFRNPRDPSRASEQHHRTPSSS